MMLSTNDVIEISQPEHYLNGIHRVIACPPAGGYFIFRINTKKQNNERKPEAFEDDEYVIKSRLHFIDNETIGELKFENFLKVIEIEPEPNTFIETDDLKVNHKKAHLRRALIMKDFLDHKIICDELIANSGFGRLVDKTVRENKCSRSTVYRLLDLLVENGLSEKSLYVRFHRCGAPGVEKPITESRKKSGAKTREEHLGIEDECLQQGTTAEVRVKIRAVFHAIKSKHYKTFKTIYTEIIKHLFVTKYTRMPGGELEPVMPERGTYPNQRQVQRILQGINKVELIKFKTTPGHFNRNMRGLKGRAYDGVAGPGHRYAIDATVGDIYLISGINRNWFIGRPIVYIIVDVWSSAIVGFYVGLVGPSWAAAKVALFSTLAEPALVASLWGFEPIYSLYPYPGLPYELYSDRGELLSKAAFDRCKLLGINCVIAPSYRPDLKGLVEVTHRIAKDQQFQFIPGAIDARRKELELRTDIRASEFTLQSYTQYLASVFRDYNLLADRSDRLDQDMIGYGVHPSPAGLWRYGHEVGIGYRKTVHSSQLITDLLPKRVATIRHNGVFLGQIPYEASIADEQQWTTIARNCGAYEIDAYRFPGTHSRIWVPTQSGLQTFSMSLSSKVKPETTEEEWVDAYQYFRLSEKERTHQQLGARIGSGVNAQELVKREKALNHEAKLNDDVPMISVTEARRIENLPDMVVEPSDGQEVLPESTASSNYDSFMNELYRLSSTEGGS